MAKTNIARLEKALAILNNSGPFLPTDPPRTPSERARVAATMLRCRAADLLAQAIAILAETRRPSNTQPISALIDKVFASLEAENEQPYDPR